MAQKATTVNETAAVAASTARRGFGRVAAAVVSGTLLAAMLGSANIQTSVQDWPPSPLTDHAIAASDAWNAAMESIGFARLHPWLRHLERQFEGTSDDQ